MPLDLSSLINFDLNTFLLLAGNDPFTAMFYIFLHGGWILIAWALLWGIRGLYKDYIQTRTYLKKKWSILRIAVPAGSEQTPKAAEHIFSNFAGTHGTFSWLEEWVEGMTQSQMSIEIASIEGRVSYYVWFESKFRDLIEASIFAQYPDAEIELVDDYAHHAPHHFPDEEWDVFGCEMVNVMPDPYPLRTYMDLEDKVSGEFKDPMAALLENFSRIGPGEQVWYQIVLVPTDQKNFRKRAQALVDKMMDVKKEHKKGILEQVIEFPITLLQGVAGVMGVGGGGHHPEPKKDKPYSKLQSMSPGEVKVLEGIQRKAAKLGFECKIRFIYLAKKDVMMKARALHPFIGAIKQTNTFDMGALKPDTKHTGMSGQIIFFKEARNNFRKNHIMHGYIGRSPTVGNHLFFLSAEELATLWHFPILSQVKAPQLKRTESKKMEPPANIPFEGTSIFEDDHGHGGGHGGHH